TFETHGAGRRPTYCAAIRIGKRDNGVVERRLNAHHSVRNDALFLLLAKFFLALGALRRCSCWCSRCALRFFCHAVVSPIFSTRLFLTCVPAFSSSLQPRPCAGLCASVHSYVCAAHEREDFGDDANPYSIEFQ